MAPFVEIVKERPGVWGEGNGERHRQLTVDEGS
jgi:hypothetical protein